MLHTHRREIERYRRSWHAIEKEGKLEREREGGRGGCASPMVARSKIACLSSTCAHLKNNDDDDDDVTAMRNLAVLSVGNNIGNDGERRTEIISGTLGYRCGAHAPLFTRKNLGVSRMLVAHTEAYR